MLGVAVGLPVRCQGIAAVNQRHRGIKPAEDCNIFEERQGGRRAIRERSDYVNVKGAYPFVETSDSRNKIIDSAGAKTFHLAVCTACKTAQNQTTGSKAPEQRRCPIFPRLVFGRKLNHRRCFVLLGGGRGYTRVRSVTRW